MQGRPRILIAGGGIGGISLALALGRRGIESTVLEARPAFAEAGAGIQIGPNGTRVLLQLGVADALAPFAGVPRALCVHDAISGSLLSELPLGDWIATRHGAPYWTVHRQDLHAALLATARRSPLIEIETGFPVARFEERGGEVAAYAADGRERRGSALVGADGIWSEVRKAVGGAGAHVFAGKTATRTVLPADAIVTARFARWTGVWLGPREHVVHYPVSGGREVAVVVILDESWPETTWNAPAERAHMLDRMRHVAPGLREMLESGAGWHKWALFDTPALAAWSRGRVTLIGDAAHPILPFLAQGGVMALEDAAVLAAELAVSPEQPGQSFERYEAVRLARCRRVQEASRRNGRIYHLDGPRAVARNAALALAPSRAVMATYDWLYGWRSGHGAA